MKWNSFRARLCLWNVAILAMVLGEFGLALCWTIQGRMAQILDRELAQRARRWASGALPARPMRFRSHPHRRHSRGSGMQLVAPEYPRTSWLVGMGPLSPRATSHEPRATSFDESPSGWVDESGFRAWPYDGEAERVAFFQSPRFVNLAGECIGPPSARQPWDPDTVRDATAGRARYSTVTVEVDGSLPLERVRVLTVPWRLRGRIVGAVQVARELGDYDRLWDGQARILLALLPVSLVIAGIGGVFLTNRALRPVREVTHAAAQIGAEDLSRRLQVVGQDELAELAATFNGMIARLEAAFEQQRQFTADASHELRTPLTRIKLCTSTALSGEPSAGEYRAALAAADQAADAMDRLIQQLLMLARADAGELGLRPGRVDVASVLRRACYDTSLRSECRVPRAVCRAGMRQASLSVSDAARGTRHPARAEGAHLVLDLPPDLVEVAGDEDHVYRVFVNLLENAIRHTPPDGRITLSARSVNGGVVVRVADTGEGIPPEHLARVCERFYRVDAARTRKRGGCGLGLAISRSIVQAYGGTLSIESEVGRGTVVTVTLPSVAAPGPRRQAPGPM